MKNSLLALCLFFSLQASAAFLDDSSIDSGDETNSKLCMSPADDSSSVATEDFDLIPEDYNFCKCIHDCCAVSKLRDLSDKFPDNRNKANHLERITIAYWNALVDRAWAKAEAIPSKTMQVITDRLPRQLTMGKPKSKDQ